MGSFFNNKDLAGVAEGKALSTSFISFLPTNHASEFGVASLSKALSSSSLLPNASGEGERGRGQKAAARAPGIYRAAFTSGGGGRAILHCVILVQHFKPVFHRRERPALGGVDAKRWGRRGKEMRVRNNEK